MERVMSYKKKYLGIACCMLLVLGACSDDKSEVESSAATGMDSKIPAPEESTVSTDSELLPHQQMAKAFLKEMVEIDSTHSTGSATKVAEAMAKRLIDAGFDKDDVKVMQPAETKGNLIARYRGNGSGREPLLLLAHIDVVEANPDDWELDPFTFTEKDGYYWGRGTIDDKDEAAIHVANFIRYKEEGFVPDRDIIIALTADEEGGPQNGVKWLVEEHRELIDAEYALNEGGGGASKNGQHISNNVQASEKIYQSFSIEFTNSGGHSSLPVKDNAIYHLADALARIRDYDFPVRLNEVTRAFFERTAELQEGPLKKAMQGVLQEPPDDAAIAYLANTPFYNSRLRTTCVATMINGGHRDNALPQRATATVNCRILPDGSVQDVKDTLEYVIANENVVITEGKGGTISPASPLTPEIIGAIESVTEEIWPDLPVIPIMSTGATDARYLRGNGIPVYGVSGIFSDIDDNRAHGQNERIGVESFFEGQEFLYRLVKKLSGG